MAKQTTETVDVSTLPTLDDFTEVNLLKTTQQLDLESKKKTEDAAEVAKKAKEQKEQEEIEKEKSKNPEAAKKQQELAEAKKAEEDKKKLEEEKKKKLEKSKLPVVKITPEQLDLLVKKAEEDPDKLTPEERQLLIDEKLFEEEDDSKKNFWEDVEKIHGVHVDVDYAGKDPESVEGAALRDRALMDHAMESQLEYLSKTYPEAYKILEHVSNGGQVQDLVSADEPDFSKVVIEKDNKEAQKELLTNFYLAKGFDDKRAARMVEADEDSAEGLFTVATDALNQLKAAQKEREQVVINEAKAKKEQEGKRNTNFKNGLKQITDSGKIGEFNITDKKTKEDFYDFAVKNISVDPSGNYQVVLPVNQESITPVLQQLFFTFKNGKLDEYIKKEAQTQNVKKLLKRVQQSKTTTSSQEDEQRKKTEEQKKLPTFDVFTV